MFCVSTQPSRLAPIFRSETQLRILGATYLEPKRHFTIPALVELSGRPQPTVAREVERLTEAGLLGDRAAQQPAERLGRHHIADLRRAALDPAQDDQPEGRPRRNAFAKCAASTGR